MTIEEKLLFSFPFLGMFSFCIVVLTRLSVKTKTILVTITVLLSVVWFIDRPQYLLNRWRTDHFDDSNRSIVAFGLGAHAYAYEEFLYDIVFYRPTLREVLLSDSDPKLRIRVALFLGYSKNTSDRETFLRVLDDSHFGVRLAAAAALLPSEYMRSPESFFSYKRFCILMHQDENCDPDEKTIRSFVDWSRKQIH
ncbi:HEAT repeat domain-containing protein [Leptospira yasudae]|uniref:HEAT repeat domain-containing protein n=1 Tax=Leptospira yasudae TaxID=2202201 RepID=A0ABX9M4K3_9LEPT|nr:HEAT repeat domain-containing protein [Leptospira yasudae]RHX80203.1 HEAT repeat domain-containing protein [Leptospira yasudae]